MPETPVRFSIIIPVLNRASMLPRAIDSVLSQDYPHYEIIVVDDGSTDGTADVVRAYKDPRVKLLQHPKNRGVCAARNTGIDQAVGEWFLFLDSDFEVLAGGLTTLARHAAGAPDDIGHLASACAWDHGAVTPDPMPPHDTIMSWPEYLRFVSGLRVSEWLNCIHRRVFEHIRYPETRAYEGGFHLAVSRRFRFYFTRDCVGRAYTDAVDRITIAPPSKAVRRMLLDASDCADDAERVLREFGDDMLIYAPNVHQHYLQLAAIQSLLSGHRMRGLKHYLHMGPSSVSTPRGVGILSLGMVGPKVLANAMAHWTWARYRRREGSSAH